MAFSKVSAFICVYLRIQSFLVASLLVASTFAAAQLRPSQPEWPSGWTEKHLATAPHYMVAAANPLAVESGLAVLERGGNAIDAMIATQLMLGLAEPQSSGLGGGAYLLYYDARKKQLFAYDARESAPAGATPSLFLRRDGKPMAFATARAGGRSVGVPGVPRLLEVAHARHGSLEWASLFRSATDAAQNGFPVPPRLAKLSAGEGIADEPSARRYLLDAQGKPRAMGSVLRNPAYAATLRAMAAKGADAFYTGEVAGDIVRAVRGHANAGTLSLDDLAGYRVHEAQALCAPYRAWRVCGVGPSTYGGIAVLQVLGMLERFDMASVRPGSSQAVHLLTEAERLAFADRNRYGADERFVPVPVSALLDRDYLAARSHLIRPERSMARAAPGEPQGVAAAWADAAVDNEAGTSHLSIVDRAGNAVSMTTSVESEFGSRLMVHGFFLGNTLTDFSFTPTDEGRAAANSVAPGKRPRSSMTPMLVFDAQTGAFEMALGSPGGSLIIDYVVKTLVAALDWKMDVQSAIDLPNFGSLNGPTEIEQGTGLESIAPALKAMGHDVRAIDMTSGLHAVRRTASGWEGGSDPRRDGVARGR